MQCASCEAYARFANYPIVDSGLHNSTVCLCLNEQAFRGIMSTVRFLTIPLLFCGSYFDLNPVDISYITISLYEFVCIFQC